MADFSVRSDNVDVEQIMGQIRARIREKRGVDYTEEEIRELAKVKLEKFLDPRGVRSDLLEQFRRKREASLPPNFSFEDTTIYETHRGFLRFMRRLLNPILKLFFNPNPIAEALHIQSKLNAQQAALEPLYYEVMHNLVLETTRQGIELKNLKMRLESMSSRLDFDERRARALEGVVQYRPGAVPPLQPPTAGGGGGERDRPLTEAEQAERRSRRRRRRGRRRPGEGGGEGRNGSAPGHDSGGPATGEDASEREFVSRATRRDSLPSHGETQSSPARHESTQAGAGEPSGLDRHESPTSHVQTGSGPGRHESPGGTSAAETHSEPAATHSSGTGDDRKTGSHSHES